MLWSIAEWGSIVTFLGLPESICGGYTPNDLIDQTGKKHTVLDYTRQNLIHSDQHKR
jgi:hypothetical protein